LGIESYGLVGFYATLVGSLTILDMGLTATLNRELAKQGAKNRTNKDIRNLAFSLECIYWCIGLLISLVVILLSGFIAKHWVNVESLSVPVVKNSIILMGIVLAFQWPIALYDGGLRGLEKHVLNNTIAVIMTTLRAAGVIVVLKYYSATLDAFFLWQAGISFLYVMIMKIALWKKMPSHYERSKFSKEQIKTVWRFAAGMTSISAVTFFIAQIDKIVLSKILPLSQFGYYTLAFTIASSITLIVMPLSLTFFPRFTKLVAAGNDEELKSLYHKACRLMATFIFPVSFVLIFFIQDILGIWTRSEVTTQNTYLLSQVLIIGSMFNALMVLPYNLIIAHGWVSFSIYQNAIAAVILVPMLFLWTNLYGAMGATFVWLSVNAGYIFISQPLMHRRLLKTELGKWYWNDTLLPMIPSLLIVLLIKIFLKYFMPEFPHNLLLIGCILAIAFAVSILNMSDTRLLLKKALKF